MLIVSSTQRMQYINEPLAPEYTTINKIKQNNAFLRPYVNFSS